MPWQGRDRRTPRPAPDIGSSLSRLADGQDHLRESMHDLRGSAGVILLRVDRLEKDLRRLEQHVEATDDLVQQTRGALAAMRILAGGSVLTAVATFVAMAATLNWL